MWGTACRSKVSIIFCWWVLARAKCLPLLVLFFSLLLGLLFQDQKFCIVIKLTQKIEVKQIVKTKSVGIVWNGENFDQKIFQHLFSLPPSPKRVLNNFSRSQWGAEQSFAWAQSQCFGNFDFQFFNAFFNFVITLWSAAYSKLAANFPLQIVHF
jgi:hypothetical protein